MSFLIPTSCWSVGRRSKFEHAKIEFFGWSEDAEGRQAKRMTAISVSPPRRKIVIPSCPAARPMARAVKRFNHKRWGITESHDKIAPLSIPAKVQSFGETIFIVEESGKQKAPSTPKPRVLKSKTVQDCPDCRAEAAGGNNPAVVGTEHILP